ncbi:MAG: PG0541 family transporter-associated protein [Treponemataceae bacterium]
MIRVEIIANQSVYEEITSNFNQLLPDMLYTVIPLVYGKGKSDFKLGNSTWPETNFVIIAYADDMLEKKINQIVRYVKLKFSTEGIKMFTMHDNIAK